MEIRPEYSQRLGCVLRFAEEQFWATIAARFPEAKTGDYPPDLAFARNQHNREDVLQWLKFNAPETLIGEKIEMDYIAYFKDGSSTNMHGTYKEVSEAHPDAIKIRRSIGR